MPTPGIFILSARAGEEIAQALKRVLAQAGLDDVQVAIAETLSGSLGQADTPRRLSLRRDFGIRIILASDLDRRRGGAGRDSVLYDLGVMSGALGVGRAMALLVTLDGVAPDLAGGLSGLVIDQVSLSAAGALDQQLAAHGQLLADRIRALETSAGFVMRPSTGLAIGYFKNFVMPVLDWLRARRPAGAAGQAAGSTPGAALLPARLVVCLPDSPERVTQGAWAALARRLGLQRTELGPIGESGVPRTFGLWSDGGSALYDAPATLATAADIVRRLVADEDDRAAARARALHNFERTLRLMLHEPEHAWMQGRLKIAHWSELEKPAAAGA